MVKQGERGHKFYIVLAGAVSVFVHKAKDSVETPKHQLPSGTPRASTIGVGDLVWRYGVGNAKPNAPLVCVQPHAQRWLMVPLSVWLIGVVAGDSFGELALSDPKCIRKATVVTDEPTDLLVLGKVRFRIRAAQCHKWASNPPNLLSTPHRTSTHPSWNASTVSSMWKPKPSFAASQRWLPSLMTLLHEWLVSHKSVSSQ